MSGGSENTRSKEVDQGVTEPEPAEPLKLENFRVRGNSSDAHITNVIPQVWGEILQHLSAAEFLSLINSSPLLRYQLKDETEKILLPMILPFLVTGRFISTPQALLELRKLYPVTKEAINTLFEEECSPQKYWETITTCDLKWKEWVGDDSLKLRRIWQKVQQEYNNRFQRKMQHHLEQGPNPVAKFNPFLARYFHVELNAVLLGNRESFLNFISNYGHHILHLKCSKLRDIRLLFLLLPHLTNLKVLKLYTKEKVENEDEYVKQVHYPDLPQLEVLDVEGFYDHEAGQRNTRFNLAFVKKYGAQLKALICSNKFFHGWWLLGHFFCKNLCNLQRLCVAKVGDYTLSALKEAYLPALQDIHLAQAGDFTFPGDDIRLQQVLDVVNRFDQTLTRFQLYIRMDANLCRLETLKEGSMAPSPKLTRFGTYLSNVDLDWFWPFIQHKCPNLAELKLEGTHYSRVEPITKERQEMIQRTGFQIAPKLKRIIITYGVLWDVNCNVERIMITRGSIHSKKLWMLNAMYE